jgi:hypothetical protein
LKRKNGECAACLKNSVRIFVKKIFKMGCLEGSDVPFLYTGHTVPKGQYIFLNLVYAQRDGTNQSKLRNLQLFSLLWNYISEMFNGL